MAAAAPEPFGLSWPGKAAAWAAAAAPARHELLPAPALAGPDHLLVVGDNLEALRLLQPLRGQVRLAYIDPPYNAGTDYLYADRFRGSHAGPARRHAAWLDLMAPRLLLLRELLAANGVLFASIGGTEHAHLRLLCDEVFGARHHVASVARVTKRSSNQGRHFAPSHDHLLVYARDRRQLPPFHDLPRAGDAAKFRGTDARGAFATVALFQNGLDPRPNQRYWVQCPDGSLAIPPGPSLPAVAADGAQVTPASHADRCWRWSRASYLAKQDLLVFRRSTRSPLRTPDGSRSAWNVYTKYYAADRSAAGRRPRDFVDDLTNDQGTAELRALGLDDCFPFTKPVGLLRRILHWIDARDALVVDCFAGSGTTGQAVLEQNAADGGTRRCILVQSPEATGRADFPTIAALCAERLLRAQRQLDAQQPARPGERREFAAVQFQTVQFQTVQPAASPCAAGPEHGGAAAADGGNGTDLQRSCRSAPAAPGSSPLQ
jgi:adenine-specific DNA-methyltransferase